MREHSKVALAVFSAFFLLLVAGIIFSLKILLWPVLIGFLIAFILDPLVDYFEAKGLSRVVVVALLFVAATVLLVGAIAGLVQPVVRQVQRFVADAPAYRQLMRTSLSNLVVTMEGLYPNFDWAGLQGRAMDAGGKYWAGMLRSMPAVFTNVFGVVASAVIVPFVTFFLLLDGTKIKKQIIGLVPNRYFEMALTLFHKVHSQIYSYMRGTLLDCSIVAVLYAVGYSILQVKYGVFLGVFAGVCNLVPYVGPWLAAGAPMIVMFFDASAAYPWWSVLIVVVIVQFVENNIIYPIVLGRSVEIHPLIIMFGLFVGGEIGGLLGMILAVPLIAVVKVVAEVLYRGLKQFSVI